MRLFLAACLVFITGAVHAQQNETNPPQIETSKVFGEYEVFYSVFPSTMLTEAVAKADATVAPSPPPAVYGQAATFSATVSVTSPGSSTPTGTVTFTTRRGGGSRRPRPGGSGPAGVR